jgi:hypothetical protein
MTNLWGTPPVPFESFIGAFGHGRVVALENSDAVAGSAELEGCG